VNNTTTAKELPSPGGSFPFSDGKSRFQPFSLFYRTLHHILNFYRILQPCPSNCTNESSANAVNTLPRFSENARNSRFIVQIDGDFLSLSIRQKNDCRLHWFL